MQNFDFVLFFIIYFITDSFIDFISDLAFKCDHNYRFVLKEMTATKEVKRRESEG